MSEDSKRIVNFILALVCISIIYNYFQQVQDIPNPASKMYTKWIKSLDLKTPNVAVLTDIHLQIQINKDAQITTWNLNGKEQAPEKLSKLSRLLELADSTGIFAKSNSEKLEQPSVSVEVKNSTKSYHAQFTEEQIANDPQLQTFIKLAELYAGQNSLSIPQG